MEEERQKERAQRKKTKEERKIEGCFSIVHHLRSFDFGI
jgi:hypothetical protein